MATTRGAPLPFVPSPAATGSTASAPPSPTGGRTEPPATQLAVSADPVAPSTPADNCFSGSEGLLSASGCCCALAVACSDRPGRFGSLSAGAATPMRIRGGEPERTSTDVSSPVSLSLPPAACPSPLTNAVAGLSSSAVAWAVSSAPPTSTSSKAWRPFFSPVLAGAAAAGLKGAIAAEGSLYPLGLRYSGVCGRAGPHTSNTGGCITYKGVYSSRYVVGMGARRTRRRRW